MFSCPIQRATTALAMNLKSISTEDEVILEMDAYEDVAAELEDFIFLARLGLHEEALEAVDSILWRHLNLFAVLAEVGGFLVEQNHLEKLGDVLGEAKTQGVECQTYEEKAFVELLEQIQKGNCRCDTSPSPKVDVTNTSATKVNICRCLENNKAYKYSFR